MLIFLERFTNSDVTFKFCTQATLIADQHVGAFLHTALDGALFWLLQDTIEYFSFHIYTLLSLQQLH